MTACLTSDEASFSEAPFVELKPFDDLAVQPLPGIAVNTASDSPAQLGSMETRATQPSAELHPTRPPICIASPFGLNSLAGTLIPETQVPPLRKFKLLYFFAGEKRKGDIHYWMREKCLQENCELIIQELDLLRGGLADDLSAETTQDAWITRLEEFDAVICTPPYSTFSRAPWANSYGPKTAEVQQISSGIPMAG